MATEGFDINKFKANFDGGARAYLFKWTPTFPGGIEFNKGSAASYLVKSSTFPGDEVEEIIVNWQGVDYKMAGKRTFPDWTLSFNVDRKSTIRKDFGNWIDAIHTVNGTESHKYGTPGSPESNDDDLGSYFSQQTLYMLDYNGDPVSTLTLHGSWPKSIGEISLDYSSMEVATFDVTFTYQYHTIE